MADVLSKIRADLEKRLHELEPLIEEHAHVRKALDALNATGTRSEASVKRAVKRTRAAATSTVARGRGRPSGSGARAQQAVKLVHTHPGITIQELAKRMKIKPNYLYRVLPQLEKDGKVAKKDKGYHPPEG
ncbi:MAG: MarR family transcriptional regulator [Solirubrobacteraceae bacterium]|jgi:ribosomal protein S25